MTPTEMARRSDSLYMDTKNMHRRQLCDMVAHRETDIEDLRDEAYGLRCDIGRLESENARLRSELESVGTAAYLYGRGDINDENAKLRELVQDFDKCLTEAVRLAYIQGHMTIDDGTLLDSLHPRMRELRIEVDDG